MKEFDINKVAVELVKQFSKPVVSGATNIGKSGLEKLKVNLELCFTKYLSRNYDRYEKTKTLLYREVPVSMKDFYVRTDLMLGTQDLVKESEFIDHIQSNQRIVITGTAGSGKSTFCKSIFLDLVEKPKGIFPIFIELRHLNQEKEKDVLSYVSESLSELESTFSKQQLDYALKLGKILLIFDGFDEIHSDKRDRFEEDIVSVASKYQNIMILVSSRPDGRFSSWDEFYQYNVLPLDKEKAKSLIVKLEYDRQIKRQFLKELEDSLYEKHESFAKNPLLLTMMLLTFEQIAEIPNKIHLFYEQAFLTLFNKHDSLKSLYKRKSFSGLPLDDFKKLLSAFSVLSYSDRKYHFSEQELLSYIKNAKKLSKINTKPDHFLNDLIDSVCIMQRDGLGFTFTHRSFQEYFTALFLVEFVSDHKFDLIDKIAFINDRDDVIPIIFDINSDLLEQEWIIPRLESMINDFSIFPSTNEGHLMALARMYKGLMHRGHNDERETVYYRLHSNRSDHAHFSFYLSRIYSNETKKYFKKRKAEFEVSPKELIRLDLSKQDGGFLDLANLDSIRKATKSRIIKSGVHKHVTIRLDYSKEKLAALRKQYSKKQNNISNLLLGDQTMGDRP
ncbi:MAG: NACHT domain-containing protein [Agarilytica sp.]